MQTTDIASVDVSDIFIFLLLGGWGSWSPRRQEGGEQFLLKVPGEGGGSPWVGGGGGKGPGGCLRGIGGGATCFFSGPNSHQVVKTKEFTTSICKNR